MLLFQPVFGYYGNVTQAFKEACKYTESAEKMSAWKAQKNNAEFVKKF